MNVVKGTSNGPSTTFFCCLSGLLLWEEAFFNKFFCDLYCVGCCALAEVATADAPSDKDPEDQSGVNPLPNVEQADRIAARKIDDLVEHLSLAPQANPESNSGISDHYFDVFFSLISINFSCYKHMNFRCLLLVYLNN